MSINGSEVAGGQQALSEAVDKVMRMQSVSIATPTPHEGRLIVVCFEREGRELEVCFRRAVASSFLLLMMLLMLLLFLFLLLLFLSLGEASSCLCPAWLRWCRGL